MRQLPCLTLPLEFIHLLKMNMYTSSDSHQKLISFIRARPGLLKFIEQKFSDLDSKGRLDYILQSLGWISFRERLAALYYEHAAYHRYPASSRAHDVIDLRKFEGKILDYTVEGHSRGFLLGYYLKCSNLYYRQNGIEEQFNLHPSIYRFMKKSFAKVVEIDWVVLSLHFYIEYLGESRVEGILNGRPFQHSHLDKELKPDQKKEMASNLLNYGQSIYEIDLFANLTV